METVLILRVLHITTNITDDEKTLRFFRGEGFGFS
jgi:hypothetical protein